MDTISFVEVIVPIIGWIATVVALVLSFVQLRSAYSQTRELNEIRHSMSTQYIGQFPQFIPDVVNLIQGAKNEVLIAYGQVTYGIFSYGEKWFEYRNALEKKLHEGIKVELLCLNSEERVAYNRAVFTRHENMGRKS